MPESGWFFRVIEQEDGSWTVNHGLTVLGRYESIEYATAHALSKAEGVAPSTVFSHHLDGRMSTLATFDVL